MIEVHEAPKPAAHGVTLTSGRGHTIIVGIDDDPTDHGRVDIFGRFKVRTVQNYSNASRTHLAIDFIEPSELSAFAHGILRVIGEEL